jgi:hypothetical protein
MSSIFASLSSAVSDIGQGIYNLYDRAVCYCSGTPPAKIAIIISKIKAQNSSLHNLYPEELTDIAENLNYFKLPLKKRIELAHELVNHRLVSILAKSNLLSQLSEKANFQIAKKSLKDDGMVNCFAEYIDKFNLSEEHRFFLAKKMFERANITDCIEKFHLDPKKVMEIPRRSLRANNAFNRVRVYDIINFYFKTKASLISKNIISDNDIAVIAQRLISNRYFYHQFGGTKIRSEWVSLENREKIVNELLKTEDGISTLSEQIKIFDLPLEKREKIAYFLLNNNFKKLLLENIESFNLPYEMKLKLVNLSLKNKKAREKLLLLLPNVVLKNEDARNIYKKYVSIELQDPRVLDNFRLLDDQDFSKKILYIKYKDGKDGDIDFLEALKSLSFYFDYFSKEFNLSEQNQTKLLEIFDKLINALKSNLSASVQLFRYMILFLSKTALSKTKDLSFLDDKNFFINMFLSLAEVKPNTKSRFFENLEKNKKTMLKDSRNYEPLIKLLSLLCEKHLNKYSSIDNFLNQIFDPKNKESPVERFKLILAFGNLNLLDKIDQPTYLPSAKLIKILSKQLFIELDIEVDFQAFEKNVLNKIRDVSALFTYLGKIKTLNKFERDQMKASLKAIVTAMLNGTYKNYRKDSPHLKELLEKDKSFEVLINEWLKEGCIEVIQTTDATDGKEKVQNVRFFEFLKLKLITDKHLSNLQELFPDLSSVLRNDFDSSALNNALSAVRQKIQTAIASHNNKALINLKAENALLTACFKPKCSIDEVLRLIQIAFPIVNDQKPQILLDVEAFIKTLSKKDETLKDCVFSMSGGISDLLLLGRETGGCQNVDGEASLNKYLLGYSDGKTQVWSIKNKDGRLIARAIAKLLYSEKREAPVIFLERVYSLDPNKAFEEALIRHAKIRAKELKLPLLIAVKISDEEVSLFLENLESYGSSAPFEYSDAAYMSQNFGTYRINYSKEIS